MNVLVVDLVAGAALAGFVQGLSGFAFSLVSLSVWAWAVEPKLAAILAIFGALAGQVIAAVTARRGFDMRTLLPFVVGGLAGIPIGVAVLPHLDVTLFKAALGAFLVVWCPLMLVARRLPAITGGGRVADGIVGMFGGMLGGIGGFAGPIPTLWCTLRRFEKDAQRSIIQTFNLTILAATMATYVVGGYVTRDMLPSFAIVGIALLIPTLIGARVYVGLSEASFRRLVLTLLTCSGLALLASAVPALFARGVPNAPAVSTDARPEPLPR